MLPLFQVEIHAGGVVTTDMEQDDITGRNLVENLGHSVPVHTLGLGVVVGIFGNLQTGVSENALVIGPCRLANPDFGVG